jgi:N-acetylglucosaminyl-diphospho-decaprenol L-rhamnosyltransferase
MLDTSQPRVPLCSRPHVPVSPRPPLAQSPTRPLPHSHSRPRVSALIVSYNTRDLLLEAVGSLADKPDTEIVVVDNASSDNSADAVAAQFPAVKVVRSNTNLGFAAGVNRGAEHASGEFLLLLNSDAALRPGALGLLVHLLDTHPMAAAVGAALAFPDGSPQPSAFKFPGLAQVFLDLFPVGRLAGSRLNGRYHAAACPIQVDHPLGACVLVRRTAWDDVGPLDDGYFMYVEEVDWCRRARQRGWEIWHQPKAVAIHHGAQSTSQQRDIMFVHLWRSRLRYFDRFHGRTENRLVRWLVRLGMRAEARRAHRTLAGQRLDRRLAAISAVRELAS